MKTRPNDATDQNQFETSGAEPDYGTPEKGDTMRDHTNENDMTNDEARGWGRRGGGRREFGRRRREFAAARFAAAGARGGFGPEQFAEFGPRFGPRFADRGFPPVEDDDEQGGFIPGGRGGRFGGPGRFGPGGFGPGGFGPGGFGGGFGPGGFGPGGPGGPGGRGRGHGPGRGRRPRGNVRAAVLALLMEEPRHGYAIMTELAERSGGLWRPSPGSVYPVLQQLQDEGLVTAEESEGRKVFSITAEGRTLVEQNPAEFAEPWSVAGPGPRQRVKTLFEGMAALGPAVQQVARLGTAEQAERARVVLDEARRSLYRILAEDESASPQASSVEDDVDIDGDDTTLDG